MPPEKKKKKFFKLRLDCLSIFPESEEKTAIKRNNLHQVSEYEMQTNEGKVVWLDHSKKEWPREIAFKGRSQVIQQFG